MRPRIHYTESQKALMWERWQKGESLQQIAQLFDRNHSSIQPIRAATGGIRPASRCRSQLALTLAEREEISRAVVAGHSIRAIAAQLGRAPSTISREIKRNECYRASEADQSAWDRGRRPKTGKLAANRALAHTVAGKLRLQWSPEQVAGWLKRAYPDDTSRQVSPETIYRSLFIQATRSRRCRSPGARISHPRFRKRRCAFPRRGGSAKGIHLGSLDGCHERATLRGRSPGANGRAGSGGSFASYKTNVGLVKFWESSVSQLRDPIDPAFAREFQASTLASPITPQFFELVMRECLKVPASVWRQTFEGFMEDDFSRELAAIEAHTLLIWGDRDAFAPRGDQEVALSAIRNAALVVYQSTGHAVHWEQPARFAADLVKFINTYVDGLSPQPPAVSAPTHPLRPWSPVRGEGMPV